MYFYSVERILSMNTNDLNRLGSIIIASAFEVRNELGPFLVEKIYEEALMIELRKQGLEVQNQIGVPVYYKGQKLDFTPIIDLMVENEIILELKAVQYMEHSHVRQLISYLHLTNKRLGYLINFHAPKFKVANSSNSYRDNLGIYRYANNI